MTDSKIAKLEVEIKHILEEIEKLKRQEETVEGNWKPKVGETYWSINVNGEVVRTVWYDVESDNSRYGIGNCYKTEEEANFQAEKLKVIHELKQFEDKEQVWDDITDHYFLAYLDETRMYIEFFTETRLPNTIYFEDMETAKKAIEAVGEDRILKYYFGIERGGKDADSN